jgi:CRISPR-associated protein Cas1
MPVLYVTEPGAVLRKSGERLVVTKEDVPLASMPALHVEQVVVFGPAHLTTPALAFLLERGIDVVLLSSLGRYFGRVVGSTSGFGELRLRQYEAYQAPERRLALARAFVAGKLSNQRALLQRAARRQPQAGLDDLVAQLERGLDAVRQAPDMGTLRGLEGTTTRVYFVGFRRLLRQELGFYGRVRRPPRDPVNSMLSLGYTLLASNIHTAVQVVGLDPYLGFLHSVERTRPSLVLDLMEEFRSVIVDRLVLELVNEGIVGPDDFEQPPEAEGATLLGQRARKRFLEAFEARVQTATTAPDGTTVPTYRRWFERQARQVASLILGRGTGYRAFRLR